MMVDDDDADDECRVPNLLKLFNIHFDWIGNKRTLRKTSAMFQSMGINKFGTTHVNKVKGIKSFINRKRVFYEIKWRNSSCS